jgi:hypothetical protein
MRQLVMSLLAILYGRKGQFATISYSKVLKRDAKRGKVNKEKTIIKHVVATQIRLGHNYEAKATTQERRESGELPSENQGLRGKEWVEFPFIQKSLKEGSNEHWLVIYKEPNVSTIASRYEIDGVEVDWDTFVEATTQRGNGVGRTSHEDHPWPVSVEEINYLKVGGTYYVIRDGAFHEATEWDIVETHA